jgi:hypothetical protein
MKQLIGLIRLGALTAASVVAHRKTLATKTLDRQLPREGELVLLGIDGTVVAREINLAPHARGTAICYASITRTLASTSGFGRTMWIADAHRDGKRFVARSDEKADCVCGSRKGRYTHTRWI